MELSLPKLFLIFLIVVMIFGARKLPQVMGDLGKSIRMLKEGLKGDDGVKTDAPKSLADKDKNA